MNFKGKMLYVVAIIILLFVIVIKRQDRGTFSSHPVSLTPSPIQTVTKQPVAFTDDINTWKEYRIKNTNISFKLPPELSKEFESTLYYTKENDASGSEICMSFATGFITVKEDSKCFGTGNTLRLGGTTLDFMMPRGLNFIEGDGYVFKNGSYYYRYSQNQTISLNDDNTIVKKIRSANGIDVLSVKIKNKTDGEGGWVQPYELAAIINTHNATYPGIQIVANKDKGIEEELFNKILSTFKFNKEIAINNNLYTIHLPVGWHMIKDELLKPMSPGENNPRLIRYENNFGDYFEVDVDPVGYEVSSDLTWHTELNRATNEIRLLDSSKDMCKANSSPFCSVRNGRLDIFIKLSDNVANDHMPLKYNTYCFFAGNSKSEDNIDTEVYKNILERIMFN